MTCRSAKNLLAAATIFFAFIKMSQGAEGTGCATGFQQLGQILRATQQGWTREVAAYPTIRAQWDRSNFSDAAHFDRSNFRFIVEAMRTRLEDLPAYIRSHRSGSKGSASLISNEFKGTVEGGNWGVILDVPPENIVASAPFDMNKSGFNGLLTDDYYRNSYGLHSPERLLRETIDGELALEMGAPRYDRPLEADGFGSFRDLRNWNRSRWNEIKFHPVVGGSTARVRGLFWNSDGSGFRPPNPKDLERLKKIADELGLPLVVL